MAKTLQFRRGTTSEINAITGAVGELFVDTTKDTVVVMDGTTAGGKPLATEAALAAKADTTALTSGLAAKADTSALSSGLASKQNTLVSGNNIKTINGTSILGSGNITIAGGSGGSADLTQVTSDITPSFSEVYDIGSTTNRFYDAYLSNKLDIATATLSGSMTGSAPTSVVTNIPAHSGTINRTDIPGANPVIWGLQSIDTTPYPANTLFIGITNGTTDVAGILSIANTLAVGSSLQIYNEFGNFADSVNTIGAPFVRADGTAVLIPLDRTNEQGMAWFGMAGAIRIDYSSPASTATITTPDTREWSLASNASLIAPEVLTDTALLGDLHIAGSTITPAHTLGEYIDTKGTTIVDGSLKVNDSLQVRNKVTLRQEGVQIGKVVSFSSVIGTVTTNVASTDNWALYFMGSNYMGGYNFYAYSDQLQWSMTDLTTSPTASKWLTGNYVTITNPDTGKWWKLQFTSNAYYNGMGTSIQYVEVENSSGQSLYSFTNNGMSQLGQSGQASYAVSLKIEAQATVNTVNLDNAAIALSAGSKVLINGSKTTTPVLSTLTVAGQLSSLGIYDSGSGMSQYSRYIDLSSDDWVNTTNTNLLNVKSVFANGNTVTITYNGQSGQYSVSNTGISNGMMGTNRRFTFDLTFISGIDHVNQGQMSYAFGIMGQTVSWSANVVQSIDYSTYIDRLASGVGPAYQSTKDYTWLSVGDVLSYIPSTASLEFTRDDGTLVKSISYNNSTGEITYEGVKSLIGNNATNLSLYSESVSTTSKSKYQMTAFGYNTWGGDNSTVFGANAGVGYNGTNTTDYGSAFGAGANAGYTGVAFGQNARAEQYGTAIGAGSTSNSDHSTAIGVNSYIGAGNSGVTAWGGTGLNTIRHQNYTWTYYGSSLNSAATWYLPTNNNYYSPSTSPQAGTGVILNSILGFTDCLARIRMTAYMRKPSWAGMTSATWNIVTQEYVISNTGNDVFTLTAVGSPVTTASGGNTAWNTQHTPSLEITTISNASTLVGKVAKTGTDYAQVAIKIEMQSVTWAHN